MTPVMSNQLLLAVEGEPLISKEKPSISELTPSLMVSSWAAINQRRFQMLHLCTLREQCELSGRLFSLQCQQHEGAVHSSVCCLEELQRSGFFFFSFRNPSAWFLCFFTD